MRVLLAAVAVLAPVVPAAAEPVADLVIYWAPAAAPADVRDQARAAADRHGAAFLDRSPAAAPASEAPRLVADGIAAYTDLRFDDAVAALDRAAAEIDRTGAAGLDGPHLGELFLFRGLARIQRGDPAAWDDLVTSARIDPTRALDPARFPPRAIEQLERARASVLAQPPAALAVTAPAGCRIAIDGAPSADGRAEVVPGAHWVLVACAEHAPWGRRIVVASAAVTVAATPAPIAPPPDDAALIQARAAGARGVLDVVVAGGVARVRLRRADGRELGRSSVALDGTAPSTIAAAIDRLLAPASPPRRRWYRSRWVWAAGGAALAAAVLVPIALSGDDEPRDAVIRPTGWPPW